MTNEEAEMYKKVATLGVVGLIAGLGSLLASTEILTIRVVIGRAVSSLTLGIGAASVVAIIPGVSDVGQIGLACLAASLGTSGLERMFQAWRK